MASKASSEDLAELRAGSASPRDKAEAARGNTRGSARRALKSGKNTGASKGSTRTALKSGRGGAMKRRSVKKP